MSRSCKPTDGLYKEGHKECEKCWKGAKDLCKLNAVFREKIELEEEVIREEKPEYYKEKDD